MACLPERQINGHQPQSLLHTLLNVEGIIADLMEVGDPSANKGLVLAITPSPLLSISQTIISMTVGVTISKRSNPGELPAAGPQYGMRTTAEVRWLSVAASAITRAETPSS